MGIDIVALQEPAINPFNCTIASKEWIPVYPTMHRDTPNKTRTVTLVQAQLSTDVWNQIDFPSGDVMVIQVSGDWGKLTIFNIYNEGESNITINKLTKFHKDNQHITERNGDTRALLMWVGDFNRHHPHWDDPNDTRLFTNEALKVAEHLIEAVAEVGLEMALPGGIPTHCHYITKHWSRLDQVFISEASENVLTTCETLTEHRGAKTDHLPIRTELNLEANVIEEKPTPNFREVSWEDFWEKLATRLATMQPAERINNQRQLNRSCRNLTETIQKVIEDQAPKTRITTKSKRWWTKELTQM
jgi:exonuclease III